jgi:anti-anti-sigma regulatory factor
MNIVFDDSSGAFILRVSGDMRMWGCREAENLRLVNLLRAQEKLPKRLILNLAEVKQVDSLGVGALGRVVAECGKQEMRLSVVLPTGTAGKVLRLVHIFDAWPEFPDEAAAFQASLKTTDAG